MKRKEITALFTTLVVSASSASAVIFVNDSFDDGDLTTNTNGEGTGFDEAAQSNGSSNAETGGSAILDGISNGGTRLRINSKESVDTTALGTTSSFLFEDLLYSLSSNDSGDGTTFRNLVGVKQSAGASPVDTPGDGYYVAVASAFYTSGGGLSDDTVFFHEAGGTRTVLATWDFDNLSFTDDPAEVTGNPLNLLITLDALNWGVEITGDTRDGGQAISFSGTNAGSLIVNGITTGSAYVGTQTESPNVQVAIGRIEIEQVPEPSTGLLLLGGVTMLLQRRKRA